MNAVTMVSTATGAGCAKTSFQVRHDGCGSG
jgi:hypothetical protein